MKKGMRRNTFIIKHFSDQIPEVGYNDFYAHESATMLFFIGEPKSSIQVKEQQSVTVVAAGEN